LLVEIRIVTQGVDLSLPELAGSCWPVDKVQNEDNKHEKRLGADLCLRGPGEGHDCSRSLKRK
jgi:hypothetical protein